MYFCGQFNLDGWDTDAKYCVLDDIDITFFPHYKCFLGCQEEFTVTDKYRKKKTVRFGIPTIWLANPEADIRDVLPRARDWLTVNCEFVVLMNPLF